MSQQGIPPHVVAEIVEAFVRGGEDKAEVIKRYRESPWNYSLAKIYRIANDNGWESGRKVRKDKGEIRCEKVTPKHVEMFAAVALASMRHQKKKRLISTAAIQQQLALNGHPEVMNMAPATFNTWMRRMGLDSEQQVKQTPATPMRSLHPNHIHFLDASICVQWDFRGGKKMVARDMKKAFYKNKPGYWKEVKKVLVRWLLVDHTSGAFFVRYTYSTGECAQDVLDALFEGWGRKSYESRYPFHGVPLMLGIDASGANQSHPVKKLLEKLHVKPYTHEPGNARANGSVESIHDYWERSFEWQLVLKLAEDIEELNDRARDHMIYVNAMLVHSRHGNTRRDKWNEITREQLRELPPIEHCRKLATYSAETRTPNEHLRISFDGRQFQLYAPALQDRRVTVELDAWNPDILHVKTENGEPVECTLIRWDEHGFDQSAPAFGEGRFIAHRDPPAVKLAKTLDVTPIEEFIPGFEPRPTSPLVPSIPFLPRRGHEITLGSLPAAPRVRAEQVARRVREALELDRITSVQAQQLISWLEGRADVSEEEIPALVEKAAVHWNVPNPAARSAFEIQQASRRSA